MLLIMASFWSPLSLFSSDCTRFPPVGSFVNRSCGCRLFPALGAMGRGTKGTRFVVVRGDGVRKSNKKLCKSRLKLPKKV